MALQVSPSASSKIRRARRAKSARTALPLPCCRSSTISASVKFIVPSKEVIYYLFKRYGPLLSRHGSDVVGCAQPSERSARRIAQPIPSVLASDATPRCASMASADRQMIGDATPGPAASPAMAPEPPIGPTHLANSLDARRHVRGAGDRWPVSTGHPGRRSVRNTTSATNGVPSAHLARSGSGDMRCRTRPPSGGARSAVVAPAVQGQFVALHDKPLRRKLHHVPGALMHIEYAMAQLATEMMVVLVPGQFIAGRLPGEFDHLDLAGIHELFEVAVNGGQPDVGHSALRRDEDLARQQWAPGGFHHRSD